MVVDRKSGYLLNKLKEIDGAVEQRWLKLLFEIDLLAVFSWLELVDIIGDVDQGDNVDCELGKYRRDDVPIPDVVLRSLSRQCFNGLRH